mmetsp:Transcript_34882/g.107964  ORF Transcript_34882/g.107964 Transcript_34882/m.107964 type:complete len:104 (-) Transcript_34882:267-578(-)
MSHTGIWNLQRLYYKCNGTSGRNKGGKYTPAMKKDHDQYKRCFMPAAEVRKLAMNPLHPVTCYPIDTIVTNCEAFWKKRAQTNGGVHLGIGAPKGWHKGVLPE